MSGSVNVKNIAIVAHVDHGKTSLVDNLLKQSGTFRENQEVDERVMDSNDLEKERGITILAKVTSVIWNDTTVNIIDTPGHSDFGGEVERIISMVDCVILLVDSVEGPMPQTKFVLSKAIAAGLNIIVVINKVDRDAARPTEVVDEVFDLFISLGASDEQADFTVLYASGRDGWCINDLSEEKKDLKPLFEKIVEEVPNANSDELSEQPFSMLVTLLDKDNFLGKILIGRVHTGKAKINTPVKVMSLDGKEITQGRLTKLLKFSGLTKSPTEEAYAGDIVAIAGIAEASVSDTICDIDVTEPIPSTPIDPPTLSVTVGVNTSPLAGREGSKLTGTMIGERLYEEAETNVAIKVSKGNTDDAYELSGRGELQLGVLIETMRREGFELSVSRPKVLFKEENGEKLEPMEEVIIDVDEDYSGVVMEKLIARKGEMQDMSPPIQGRVRMNFICPSRGLIGYHGNFLTDTRGTGTMNKIFHSYGPYKGKISGRQNGALISTESGKAVAYAIFNLQDRGIMFVAPQDEVYEGMVVGEHNRANDLEINVLKGKKLTNMRASGSDENVVLAPPKVMTLETMMSYIEDDELVEVTPNFLRLRKVYLNPNDRKRFGKKSSD